MYIIISTTVIAIIVATSPRMTIPASPPPDSWPSLLSVDTIIVSPLPESTARNIIHKIHNRLQPPKFPIMQTVHEW